MTYLTTDQPGENTPEFGPVIDGWKTVAISWGNVFEERDEAWTLIAEIVAAQNCDLKDELCDVDPYDKCEKFLIDRGYGKTYLTLIDNDKLED